MDLAWDDDAHWPIVLGNWGTMPKEGERRRRIERALSFDDDRPVADIQVRIYPNSPESNHVRLVDQASCSKYACYLPRIVRRAIYAGYETQIIHEVPTDLPPELHPFCLAPKDAGLNLG